MSTRHTQAIAWPIRPQPPREPIKFDSMRCSDDGRLRVVTVGAKHYVSIDGDAFCGPHKTLQAAIAYGAAIAAATGEQV